MTLAEVYVVPEPPQYSYETGWTQELYYYSGWLETAAVNRYRDAAEARAHYTVRDLYRHAYELVQDVRREHDAEMLFVYADWIFKTNYMVAVRSAVQVLRKHHEGAVRHLVTEDRISACLLIGDALSNRGRTNWENNRECAYLAFDDPSMTPKIIELVRRGLHKVDDIKAQLPRMEDVEVSLVSGVL